MTQKISRASLLIFCIALFLFQVAIVQAEDELAAIGVVLGATWNGARAFTPTSGPGISLMSEFIGLGYFAEIPVVLFDVQRMGPATGGATTTAQGDVQFIRWGTGGGYPIIALAPKLPAASMMLRMKSRASARSES